MTTPPSVQPFLDLTVQPAVRGFLHLPARSNGDSLLLTHGAGANCQSNLLVTLAAAFAEAGFTVLRYDLPFRKERRFGPPFPATAVVDRDGIHRAIEIIRQRTAGRVLAGGHSYGGRQTTMLVAEHPALVEGLLLLSYPLHPPRKPAQLRTGHFPRLIAPALFVHGTRDPFGSLEEMRSALELIPGKHKLLEVEGAGHDLLQGKGSTALPRQIVESFQSFLTSRSDQYSLSSKDSTPELEKS